jgi:hypothetical protein
LIPYWFFLQITWILPPKARRNAVVGNTYKDAVKKYGILIGRTALALELMVKLPKRLSFSINELSGRFEHVYRATSAC